MKIAQAAVLVFVGALSAMLYVKVKGGPQPEPIPIQASSLPEAKPVAETIEVDEPPTAPAPEVAPAPARASKHREKKHARVLTSSLRTYQPSSNRVEIQPAPTPQPAPNPPAATPPPAPAPVAEPAPQQVEEPAPAPPPPPKQATLKAGMLVAVRLIDTVSSDKNHPGDTFTGTLDQSVDADSMHALCVEQLVCRRQQALAC